MESTSKVTKAPRKKKMANKYVQEKKNSVKRKLFCDEQPRSPKHCERSNTPLSYDVAGSNSATVFFMGFKFPYDEKYKCQTCFEKGLFAGLTDIEKEQCVESNLTHGEISLVEFYNRLESREDQKNKCSRCNIYLTIIRPYDSAHLDFA